MPAAGRLDGIDIADEVRYGDIGRGQLLHVTLVPSQPGDWCCLSAFGEQLTGIFGDGCERIVIYLAAGNDGNPLVQEAGQLTQESTLGLTPETEQNEVVSGKQCVHDVRQDGIFVADNARKQRLTRLQSPEQVTPNLV